MLSAVVVHRRRPDACVRTISLLHAQGVDRVVVVDNASPAEDRKAILDAHPDVVLLENDTNLGFGPAANVGFRWWLDQDDGGARGAGGPRGEWALLCPHDAQPEDGCIDALLAAARDRPRAGLACAEYGDH